MVKNIPIWKKIQNKTFKPTSLSWVNSKEKKKKKT